MYARLAHSRPLNIGSCFSSLKSDSGYRLQSPFAEICSFVGWRSEYCVAAQFMPYRPPCHVKSIHAVMACFSINTICSEMVQLAESWLGRNQVRSDCVYEVLSSKCFIPYVDLS